mgnify:CR=1 FL=1
MLSCWVKISCAFLHYVLKNWMRAILFFGIWNRDFTNLSLNREVQNTQHRKTSVFALLDRKNASRFFARFWIQSFSCTWWSIFSDFSQRWSIFSIFENRILLATFVKKAGTLSQIARQIIGIIAIACLQLESWVWVFLEFLSFLSFEQESSSFSTPNQESQTTQKTHPTWSSTTFCWLSRHALS